MIKILFSALAFDTLIEILTCYQRKIKCLRPHFLFLFAFSSHKSCEQHKPRLDKFGFVDVCRHTILGNLEVDEKICHLLS